MDNLGPYTLNSIHVGDSLVLGESIPDNSVDLIICDPVYQNIEQYKYLGRLGQRVLVEGGNLIAQSGQFYFPQCLNALGEGGLDYVWIIAQKQHGGHLALYKYKILATWKPNIWYSKGKRNGEWVLDWIKDGNRQKNRHEWQDAPDMFVSLIERLTTKDGIILDPFTGSGTIPRVCKMLGRKFLAFEIDESTAYKASVSLEITQTRLFEIHDYGQATFMDEGK